MRHTLQTVLTLAALGFLFTVLVIANRLSWIPASFFYFPLEFMLLGLLLLPGGWIGTGVRWAAAIVLTLGAVTRIADMVTYQIFLRPFNPIFDAYLLGDGVHLLQTSLGIWAAYGVVAGVILLVVLLLLLAYLSTARYQALVQRFPRPALAVLGSALLIWGGLAYAGKPVASIWFSNQLAYHARNAINSVVDLRAFAEVVNHDDVNVPGAALFDRLRGKDVLVVFVESYGRTVVEKPEYAARIPAVLQASTATLRQHGFASRSAYLTSPTVGGISWLAHGTALSGLWIDSQIRYDSLLMSERPSLVTLFGRAGWHTVGVMPAISLPWPEGEYFGYDRTLTAPGLGYRGKPFNYVTMPDQFTLARFEALARAPADGPVMAEIALISSHAPWTPVPQLIDWEAVGDGSVFNDQATAGDPPEVVWQSKERVIRHYRDSVEYVLDTITSYVTTYGDEDLVVLVLGDHQPMPYVTDESENRDVLVHLIAGDESVLEATDSWQWSEGMLPARDAPVWRMDELRPRLIEAFSQKPAEVDSLRK